MHFMSSRIGIPSSLYFSLNIISQDSFRRLSEMVKCCSIRFFPLCTNLKTEFNPLDNKTTVSWWRLLSLNQTTMWCGPFRSRRTMTRSSKRRQENSRSVARSWDHLEIWHLSINLSLLSFCKEASPTRVPCVKHLIMRLMEEGLCAVSCSYPTRLSIRYSKSSFRQLNTFIRHRELSTPFRYEENNFRHNA